MTAKILSRAASALFLLSFAVIAAPGDLDPGFLSNVGAGITGSGYPDSFPTGAVQAMGIQPDGKILIGSGGGMSSFDDEGEFTALKRLNADGTLDGAFAPNTAFTNGPHTLIEGQGAEVNVILVNPDGSFYIGGVFANYGPGSAVRSCLAKVNADGTLDTDFVPPSLGGGQRYIQALALDGKGGLLVGGTFSVSGRLNLIRLNAETGALDGGFVIGAGQSAFPGTVDSISVAADGRIYISGTTTVGLPFAWRLLASGSYDNSFEVPFTNDYGRVNRILALPDGRVLLGGGFTLSGRPQGDFLVAVNEFGSLDNAFMANQGIGTNGWAGGVLQQLPDGRVLVGGIFNEFNGTPIASLMILGTNGMRDTNFTPLPYSDDRTAFMTHFYAAGVQPDGKLVAGGWFERVTDPDLDIRNLVRFEGETAAGAGTLRFASAEYRALESAGSVTVQVARLPGVTGAVSVNYATGGGSTTAGTDYTATNGTLNWAAGEGGVKTITIPLQDNASTAGSPRTFNVTLSAATGGATLGSISQTQVTILDDDAQVVIVTPPANVTLNQGTTLRLNVQVASQLPVTYQWQFDNGSGFQDIQYQTFRELVLGQVTPEVHSGAYRVIVNNGKGAVTSAVANVTVLTPDGSLISGYTGTSALTAPVVHAERAANGKTIVVTGETPPQLRRINADGTLDSSFTTSSLTTFNPPGGFTGLVYDLLVLPDQRILVTGFFSAVTSPSNGTGTPVSRPILARFNADGTHDTSFNPPLPANVELSNGPRGSQLARGAGGKYYVGFYRNGGLRRYNADGSLDTNFNPPADIGTNLQGEVKALRELPDGKVLVSFLNGTNGQPFSTNFWRLNADGSRDLSFTEPGAMGTTQPITAFDLLPDGRIAVVGNFSGFSTISPLPMSQVAILKPNGQVDLTFQSPSPSTGSIAQILYHNGRLIIAGSFTGFGNPQQLNVGRVARLNLDGSIDASFQAGTGATGTNINITSIHLAEDGNLFVGGNFTSFNNASRFFATKLLLNDELGSLGFDPARFTLVEETRSLQLTVQRYGPADAAASIDWATAEITAGGPDSPATAGVDFTAASGTLTWEAGDSSSRTIQIQLLDDTEQESTEAFQVVLSNPSGPVTAAANATIRLIDSDTPVTFTQHPSGSTLTAGGTLNLSAAATSPTSISYQWLRNGLPVVGATSASFTKTGVAVADAGVYQLQATNSAGSFLSNAALVVVQSPASGVAGTWPMNLTINVGGNNATGEVRAIVPTADGGAYIGGQFTNFNGQTGCDHLVKISASGVVDTTFNPTVVGTDPIINKLALHDGKLYVLGKFTQIGGGAAYGGGNGIAFAALDAATGARLTSFMNNLTTAPAGSQTTFRAMTVLSDGDLLIGGDFIQFNGSDNHKYFARLNPDGTLDAGFNTSYLGQISTALNVVQALVATSNGGFYAGGNNLRAVPGGATRDRLVKFNADGSFDATFAASMVSTVAFNRLRLMPDGQLMVAGNNLPGPSGNTRCVTRITTTGAAASDFNGPTSQTYSDIVYLPDGRTLAVGSGISFGSTSNVVMFNANGSVAGSWPSGVGFTGVPLVTELAANGEIWIGGGFSAYNGVSVQRLVRLAGTPPNPAIVNAPTAQAVNPGATAYLGVGAVGTNLTYQWFKDDVALTNGGDIAGATSALLSIANVEVADDDLYHVEVTGGSPENTVASTPVRLRVLGAPEIATQLVDQTPALGSTLTLAPEVYAAAPATYVWKRNGVTLVNGGRYSGATTASLSIAGVNATDNGSYTLTVTNGQGSVTTTAITVTAASYVAAALDPATAWVRATNTSTQINAILHLPDGRALIGSTASSAGGGVRDSGGTEVSSGLALLAPNGTLASTAAGGFARQVNVVIPLPGDKFLIAGNFSAVNGGSAVNAVRLNADFTRDNAFAPASTNITFTTAHGDAQGRVYLGGSFSNYNSQTGYNHLVRLNADGSHDTSFNAVLNGAVQSIVTLPDGRFYVGGAFSSHSSLAIPVPGLLRFLPDGRVDASFEAASLPIGTPNALAVDSLGRVIVGTAAGVRRLLPNGSIDPSFTGTVSLNNGVRSLVALPDGKILVGGFFTSPTNRFLRLNADGTRDTGFDVGTGFTSNGSVNVIAPDAIGRLWLSGTGFTAYKGVANSAQGFAILQDEAPTLAFTRLPTAARADFGGTITLTAAATGNNGFTFRWLKNGVPLSDGPGISGAHTDTLTLTGVTAAMAGNYSVRITGPGGTLTSPDTLIDVGPVVAPPVLTASPSNVTRDLGGSVTFTAAAKGALPLSFQWFHFDTPLSNGVSGGVTIAGATGPSLTISGLTFAQAGDYRVRVSNPDGTVFTEFARLTVERRPGGLAAGTQPSFNSAVRAIHLFADGSYLVGGNFSNVTINGVTTSRGRLARFLPDGTLDTAFAPNFNSSINCIAVDAAGRIFVGGTFTSLTLNGVTTNVNRVARLTSGFALDTAFDTATGSGVFRGPNNEVLTLAPVGDGSVYIGGKFTGIGTGAAVDTAAKYNRMAKLKADGSVDPGFTSGAIADVNTILRLPNGTLYVGGSSNSWLSSNMARLVKLNANGTRDNGFTSPDILNIINHVIQLPDGSLFVGGNFFGTPYLKRLNASTGADLGYSITGHVSQVNTVAMEASGRLLSGALGSFIRMDEEFVLDESLSVNFGGQQIYTIAGASDGRIFVGGEFTSVNGVTQNRFVILNGGSYESRDGQLASQTLTFAPIADRVFNPAANSFTVNPSSSSGLPVTVSVTDGPATVSGNTVTITGAGEVTLTASQSGDDTYAPATLVRTFTVAKGQQAISFSAPSNRSKDSAPFNLNASASSGLPVSFTLIDGPATLDGNTLTLTGELGTVVLTASQDGDDNWEPAAPVERSFNTLDVPPVTLSQVLSFPKLPAKRFVSESPVSLFASASSGLDVQFEVLSGPATVLGNVLTFTGTGKVTVRASQAGGPGFHPAASITQSFSIVADPTKLTFTNLVQVYDGTPREVGVVGNGEDPVITYVINGVEGPDAPVNAGSYAVIATADGKTLKGKLVVNKAPLTVTPDSQRRFIGEVNPAFTLGYTGFQGDDTRESVFAEPGAREPTASTTAKATSPGGTYVIKPAGGLLANYSFVYINGSLTVESFAGRYEALLTDAGRTVAKLELTVAASSTVFTGKLTLASEVAPLSIKGTLSLDPEDGIATGTMTPVTSKSGVRYELSLDFVLNEAFSADLNADGGLLASTEDGRRLYTPAKGDVIGFAGAHTLIFEPVSAGLPTGSGYGLATIDSKAVMKLAGRLGDGTSYTTTLQPDEQSGYRLFVQPYKRSNSYLAGPLDLDEHPTLAGRRHIGVEADAQLDWEKEGNAKDKSYRDGFGPGTVQVLLDPWLKPDKTNALVDLLELDGGAFQVSHGDIGSDSEVDLPTDLLLDTKNKIQITAPVTTPANVTKWTATLNTGTGLITGSFQVKDEVDASTAKNPNATKIITRKVSFYGVLRQSHGTGGILGRGHAMVPALPTDATNEIRAENMEFGR
jgi:uncharacterized delta-60 repeat protein